MIEASPKPERRLMVMSQMGLEIHLRDQVRVKTDGRRVIEIAVGEMTATLVNKKDPGVLESLMCLFSDRASDKHPKEWQYVRNGELVITSRDHGAEYAIQCAVMNEALYVKSEMNQRRQEIIGGLN